MSGRGSEAVAQRLREQPPTLDELAKARGERTLLAAVKAGERASTEGAGRGVGRIALGGVAALVAAAALLALWRGGAPTDRVARFELREIDATAQRGTLEPGSVLETGEGEVAEVTVQESRVRLSPGSRMRIAALAEDRLELELDRGEVRVEFHPRERGREALSVTTAQARVEVVGTVFTVRAGDARTEVSVREGVVRVVPSDAGEPRQLHAGERWTVAPRRAEVAEPAIEDERVPEEPVARAEPGEADAPDAPVPPATVVPTPTPAPTPAARLATARRWIAAGRADRAEPELRAILDAPAPRAVQAEAATLLGDLAQRSGRLDAAAAAYARAAEVGTGAVGHNAIYALARLQERRLRDPAAARASYARYLAEAPEGALSGHAREALCRLGDAARCEGAR